MTAEELLVAMESEKERPRGTCIRGVWVWDIRGEPVTRAVNTLKRRDLVDLTFFSGGSAACNLKPKSAHGVSTFLADKTEPMTNDTRQPIPPRPARRARGTTWTAPIDLTDKMRGRMRSALRETVEVSNEAAERILDAIWAEARYAAPRDED